MAKDLKWDDVEGTLDLNCEIFFLSSGVDEAKTHDSPGGRSEEREVKEVRIYGHVMSDKVRELIAEELVHIIDVDGLDSCHDAWISSDARRESRKSAKGSAAK